MTNDMNITSKFDRNDLVWFFESGAVKFYEGTIKEIQSWDKWQGFRYEIEHIGQDGTAMTYNCEEKRIFNSQQEVLANLFEANGTLNPGPTPSPATGS